MTCKRKIAVAACRLGGGVMLATGSFVPPVHAAPKGEVVIVNWLSGSDLDNMHDFEKAFMAKYPGVTVREIPITWTGDPRGAIRTALLSGESADLVLNTWPAFRKELVESGAIRPLDDLWSADHWDTKLAKDWRTLSSVGDKVYGVTYQYGDRSAIWYRTETLAKAGVAVPKTWDDFKATFPKLNAAGVLPVAVPAKVWAQAETFETLLLRVGGVEASDKLGKHQIPWTSDVVKTTFRKWREMLQAGCCAAPAVMLSTEWDNAVDLVLQDEKAGFVQLGLWINNRAQQVYKLTPGKDYDIFQFPTLGLGHDTDASVDSREFEALTSGKNPEAANAMMDFALSAEGATVFAKGGFASPSSAVDASAYGPVIRAANDIIAKSNVIFVLGDRLPNELADEYRIQLQHFLQDPTDATIDRVTEALETKAKELD